MERKWIEWNEEKSNRLYDFIAENPPKETAYFGFQVGQGILRFCKFFVEDIHLAKCLDYGCGLGHIIKYFLDDGVNMYGVDMSGESVKLVNEKFRDYPNWHGASVYDGKRLPYEDDSFDLITCTEVIEHILPKHMELFLCELNRILKPNGKIVFTTPNDENMILNTMCCPECNTLFHKHGHCNKFTQESLQLLMEKHDFTTVMCNSTDFWCFQERKIKFLDLSINRLKRIIWNRFRYLFDYHANTIESKYFIDRMHLKRRPNLFYVGTK